MPAVPVRFAIARFSASLVDGTMPGATVSDSTGVPAAGTADAVALAADAATTAVAREVP